MLKESGVLLILVRGLKPFCVSYIEAAILLGPGFCSSSSGGLKQSFRGLAGADLLLVRGLLILARGLKPILGDLTELCVCLSPGFRSSSSGD